MDVESRKNETDDLIYKTEIETQIQRAKVQTLSGGGGGQVGG